MIRQSLLSFSLFIALCSCEQRTSSKSTTSLPSATVSQTVVPMASASVVTSVDWSKLGKSPHGTTHDETVKAVEDVDLTWSVPKGLVAVPNSSPMRYMSFRVKAVVPDKDDGDLSIVKASGSVDENINRWIAQFDKADSKVGERKSFKVDGIQVTVIELMGTFNGGGMGAAPVVRKQWAVIGAIFETPGRYFFFKLMGPEKTVRSAKSDFETFVQSVKIKK